MNQNLIDKHLIEYGKSVDKQIASKYNFIKLMVTISVTLIGLLVTLTDIASLSCVSEKLFLASISSLVLCILFSLIFLSSESVFHKKEAASRLSMLKSYISQSDGKVALAEYVPIGNVYEFFEKASFVCFFLWSIIMIFYTYNLIY